MSRGKLAVEAVVGGKMEIRAVEMLEGVLLLSSSVHSSACVLAMSLLWFKGQGKKVNVSVWSMNNLKQLREWDSQLLLDASRT